MLGASAPGLIISAGLTGHFLYAGFTVWVAKAIFAFLAS